VTHNDNREVINHIWITIAPEAPRLNRSDIIFRIYWDGNDYLELDMAPENTAYFHAWYNQQVTEAPPERKNEWGTLPVETGKNPKGEWNYLILDTEGKGHYVCVNYFVNTPTLHRTGTEDYFTSSWCPNEIFQHAYYGYARVPSLLGWMGRTHCYRFHIEDPVYFDRSLRFSIEHGHNNCLTLEMASVAYWYQDSPLKLDPIPTKEERKLMPTIGVTDIHRWRHEWRKSVGPETNPWGNERLPE